MEKKYSKVLVSGGFDPVHVGHIRYFREAKKLGEKLIVILNTDDFLIEKKGYRCMDYEQRAIVLKSLEMVDEVVKCIDKDQTVAGSIKFYGSGGGKVAFAKGGDRDIDNLPMTEINVCKKNKIDLITGVGGGKIESSSKLIKEACEKLNNEKRI